MTTQEKLIRNKLGLLELGRYLGNASEACRVLGYSRDTFYRFQKAYDEGGEAALLEVSRRKPNLRNRVATEVEQAILSISIENPALGQVRVANELLKQGISVSAGGVRGVWLRHNLETMKKRLFALEEKVAKEGGILTERQLAALERAKQEKEAHGEIETQHPGYLLSQDTFYVGSLKGVGRVYQQTVIDTYSRVAHAKLYPMKTALTAAEVLNDRVVPYFEACGLPILRILTDRGTEYSGNAEQHEYQLFLALNDIEHTKTKAKSPQTNGICERFHKTILEEFYHVAFRKKVYNTIDELQLDLDEWLRYYNEERSHQGRHCDGRTPAQTMEDALPQAYAKVVNF